jgi:hypothetical protein
MLQIVNTTRFLARAAAFAFAILVESAMTLGALDFYQPPPSLPPTQKRLIPVKTPTQQPTQQPTQIPAAPPKRREDIILDAGLIIPDRTVVNAGSNLFLDYQRELDSQYEAQLNATYQKALNILSTFSAAKQRDQELINTPKNSWSLQPTLELSTLRNHLNRFAEMGLLSKKNQKLINYANMVEQSPLGSPLAAFPQKTYDKMLTIYSKMKSKRFSEGWSPSWYKSTGGRIAAQAAQSVRNLQNNIRVIMGNQVRGSRDPFTGVFGNRQ